MSHMSRNRPKKKHQNRAHAVVMILGVITLGLLILGIKLAARNRDIDDLIAVGVFLFALVLFGVWLHRQLRSK